VTPWVQRLIVANVLVFFLQATVGGLTRALTLVPMLVLVQPWTLVTYMFAHGGLGHIFFNMLSLYMFGSRVEERIGSRRFLTLYFLAGLAGAVASMFLAPRSGVIGASGAVFGVMLAFARFWPDVQILLWFFPVQARVAVAIMAIMDLYSGVMGSRTGIANFAHLGGFAGAWLYLVYLERKAGVKKFRTQTVAAVPKETLLNWKRVDPKSVHEVNRDEVNRILDKINASGIGSLTAQEKLFLSNFVPPDDRVPPVS
jgi:membrane associated rhomboid family serine protease